MYRLLPFLSLLVPAPQLAHGFFEGEAWQFEQQVLSAATKSAANSSSATETAYASSSECQSLDLFLSGLGVATKGENGVVSQGTAKGFDFENACSLLQSESLEDRAELACKILGHVDQHRGGYSDMDSSTYEDDVKVNWSSDCWSRARCILKPSSAENVSQIMKVVNFVKSKFAIRSGGHNPNPGWAGIDRSGILIDTRRLNKIELSDDHSRLNVGPGNVWVDVYEKLEGTGRTVLGGRVPDVGVGGLLLGAGIPSFSSQHGLASDHVLEYEIVLGNGTVFRANKDSHSDLWWALQGGGPNFGIVTEFELETIPMDRIWYEARIYSPEHNERLIEATYDYEQAAEKDSRASFAFSLSNNHTIVAWVYSEPEEHPEVFSMFYDIPFEKSFIPSTIGTPFTLTKAFETVLGDVVPFKRDIIALATKPSLELYKEGYKRWLSVAAKAHDDFDAMMTFGIQPLTASAARLSNRHGNPLNLSEQPQQWYTSVVQWRDDRYDDAAHAAVHESGSIIRELANEMGILLDFMFINDATFDQSPISSYGAENVRKLKAISKLYDPGQVFQQLQGNGFLLRKIEDV